MEMLLTLIQLRAGVGFLQMVLDYRYLESFIHGIKLVHNTFHLLTVDATLCYTLQVRAKS